MVMHIQRNGESLDTASQDASSTLALTLHLTVLYGLRHLCEHSQGRRSEKKARGAGNFIRAHWIYFELKSRFVDIQGASAGYEEPV